MLGQPPPDVTEFFDRYLSRTRDLVLTLKSPDGASVNIDGPFVSHVFPWAEKHPNAGEPNETVIQPRWAKLRSVPDNAPVNEAAVRETNVHMHVPWRTLQELWVRLQFVELHLIRQDVRISFFAQEPPPNERGSELFFLYGFSDNERLRPLVEELGPKSAGQFSRARCLWRRHSVPAASEPPLQRHSLELSHRIFRPTGVDASTPLLLFLHGIGECYANDPRDASGALRYLEIGHDNLLKHGPPRLLDARAELGDAHPLATKFVVVSPQLPDRGTPWGSDGVITAIERIIERHAKHARVYVMGFSKGGLGAFEVANRLSSRVRAVVTIDASPLDRTPAQVTHGLVRPWLAHSRGMWALSAKPHTISRVVGLNDAIAKLEGVTEVDFPAAGKIGARCVSFCAPPSGEQDPHSWICDRVSRAAAAYQWLLAQ